MEDIKKVYPDKFMEEDSYDSIYEYTPMIESFGYEILLKIDEINYSGDSYVLFRDYGKHEDEGYRYGYLVFGWGSCTGCDALQSAGSYKEVDELRNEIYKEIIWKNSKKELLKYLEEKDLKTEWYGWEDVGEAFFKIVKIILQNENEFTMYPDKD